MEFPDLPSRAEIARDFLAIHKRGLIELGIIIGVSAIVAGGILLAAGSTKVETACEPDRSTFVNGSLEMPKAEPDRSWNWPIPESEEDTEHGDEPTRRVHRHRRRS